MEKNTLENNIHDPDRWDIGRLDRELEIDVLGELPEFSSVSRSDKTQLFLLPVLAIVFVVAIPLIFSLSAINRRETSIDRDFPYTSLESPLLRSAVQDINNKRRELDLKDVRIRRYQDRVLDLDNKLRLLQGLMEESLQSKEQNLLSEIDSIISVERTRLEDLGQTDDQINQAIYILKIELDTEYSEQMDEFRSREMYVFERRLNELRDERSIQEKAMASAIQDRQNLAGTLEADEDDLLARLYEESDFIDIVNAGIDADLEILRETRNIENYWLDELANQYLGLMGSIAARDFTRADNHILALEGLFTESASTDLPGIKARNDADREIVRFFSAYIASLNQNDLSALLAESRLLIDLAISRNESGRYQEADIAWRELGALWPLMDQLLAGSRETQMESLGADVRQYARLSELQLDSRDYEGASSTWFSGLEKIPDPVGGELSAFWLLWQNSYTERLENQEESALTALAMEKEDSSLQYQERQRSEILKRRELASIAETNRRQLTTQIDDLKAENRRFEAELARLSWELAAAEQPKTTTEELVLEEQLISAEQQIAGLGLTIIELEKRLDEYETALAEAAPVITETSTDSGAIGVQWRLYGAIVKISNGTLFIDPQTDLIPSAGSETRIMRSLGGDRIIHLADGSILEADATRGTSRLSSSSDGAEIYGSPEVGDLVYVSSP